MAVAEKVGSARTFRYVHTDHLGSFRTVTAQNKDVLARYYYDAWGNRSLIDGAEQGLRGYTGHEHLVDFGLINMNARLYDPLLGRFLGMDPYVQMPDFTQNYNRYSYALNNPLKYSDPSGEIFGIDDALISMAICAGIGAAIGGISYSVSAAVSGQQWDAKQFWKSVGFGALSGVITSGIGSAFGPVGSMGFQGELLRGVSHGVSNGIMTDIQGGSFGQGFASGGLSSLAGSAFMLSPAGDNVFGTYAFSALSGGLSSELTGGNFWQGAGIGVMTAGLNHAQQGVEKLIYEKTYNRLGAVPLDELSGAQWANYKMRLRIYQNKDNLSVRADAYNTMAEGDVVANAQATLKVDGEKKITKALSLKGATIHPKGGFKPLGNANFKMPANGNVSINFQGGWTVYMNGGAAVPVYHPFFPYPININRTIKIR